MIDKIVQTKPVNQKTCSQLNVMLCLASMLSIPSLAMSIMNVSLPLLTEQFNTSIQLVNWVIIAYLLSITSLIIGAGSLGDKYGRRKVLRIGISIFFLASLAGALSDNLIMIMVARLIQGAGAALIIAQVYALAGSIFSRNATGSAMGLLGTMTALGTGLGPVLGSFILNYTDWSFIFWSMVTLSFLSLCLCEYIPADKLLRQPVKNFDIAGSALLAASLACYTLAMSFIGLLTPAVNIALLLLAALLLLLFLRRSKNQKPALLKNPPISEKVRNSALLCSFVVDAIAITTLIVGPFFLTYILHLSLINVGLVTSLGPLTGALSGYPAGKLVDRYGACSTMKLSLIQISVGTLSFACFPLFFGIYGYIVALLILTPGRQLFHAANSTFIIGAAFEQDKGKASALINLSRNLGLITGASLMGAIFSLLLHTEHVSEVPEQHMINAFFLTFGISFLFAVVVFSCFFLTQIRRSSLKKAKLNQSL